MKHYTRRFQTMALALLLTLTLIESAAAQNDSLSGTFGFLISPAFRTNSDATGLAVLGVINFDGAGNVTGPYTFEVDANRPQVPKTTTGMLAGTYTMNPDGTGSATIALHGGISLTLAMVVSNGGRRLQLVVTDYQLPAAACACTTRRLLLSGIASAGPVASLNGSYGFQVNIAPNVSATFGVAAFDGTANASFSMTFVSASADDGLPGPPFTFAQSGFYSIDPDGVGTLTLLPVTGVSNAQNFAFVATDGGSEILLLQLNRAGDGVAFGSGWLQ